MRSAFDRGFTWDRTSTKSQRLQRSKKSPCTRNIPFSTPIFCVFMTPWRLSCLSDHIFHLFIERNDLNQIGWHGSFRSRTLLFYFYALLAWSQVPLIPLIYRTSACGFDVCIRIRIPIFCLISPILEVRPHTALFCASSCICIKILKIKLSRTTINAGEAAAVHIDSGTARIYNRFMEMH